jgi:ketosteroid isomerase-like protein
MSQTDDVRAIQLAKTEFREGFNTGDVDRILSVFAQGFIDMSAGQPGFYGPEAHDHLRKRLEQLFAAYKVRMAMLISDVTVSGDVANDWGWHKMWLTPHAGGETKYVKLRYSEQWVNDGGVWKIFLLISAPDPGPRMEARNELDVIEQLARECS